MPQWPACRAALALAGIVAFGGCTVPEHWHIVSVRYDAGGGALFSGDPIRVELVDHPAASNNVPRVRTYAFTQLSQHPALGPRWGEARVASERPVSTQQAREVQRLARRILLNGAERPGCLRGHHDFAGITISAPSSQHIYSASWSCLTADAKEMVRLIRCAAEPSQVFCTEPS
ncbi:hypothetical protein ACVFYP_08025 [Roseomonas sp. F4]